MSGVDVLPHWLHNADALFRIGGPKDYIPPSTAMEYSYDCPCGKSFKRKATYQRHMDMAHSNAESFKCKTCGKTFGNENTLTMHMSVHDIKKTFERVDSDEKCNSNLPTRRSARQLKKKGENEKTNTEQDICIMTKSLQDCDDGREISDINISIKDKSHGEEIVEEKEDTNSEKNAKISSNITENAGSVSLDNCGRDSKIAPSEQTHNITSVKKVITSSEQSQVKIPLSMGDHCSSSKRTLYDLQNQDDSGSQTISNIPSVEKMVENVFKCTNDISFDNHIPDTPLPDVENLQKDLIVRESVANSRIQIKVEPRDYENNNDSESLLPICIENEYGGHGKNLRPRATTPIWKSLMAGEQNDEESIGNENPRKITKYEHQNSDSSIKLEPMEWSDYENGSSSTDSDYMSRNGIRKFRDNAMKRSGRENNGAVFECYICGKKFASEKYLSMHVSLHGAVKSADMLIETDEKQQQLQKQELSPHHQQQQQQQQQQFQIPAQQVVEKVIQPKPLPLVQTQENVNANSQTNLPTANPMDKKPSVRNFKDNSNGWTCRICNKFFHHTSGYKNHMRTHSDERPFVCQICDIGFKEKYHLKKHNLFIHSNELPEKCRYCGKRFKDSTAVRAHERIHSDLRPFSCRRCGKSFKTSECLWHHEHRSKSCGAPGTEVNLPSLRGQTRRRKYKSQDPPVSVKPLNNNNRNHKTDSIKDIQIEKAYIPIEEPIKTIEEPTLELSQETLAAIKEELEELEDFQDFQESDPDSPLSGTEVQNFITTNVHGVPVANIRPLQQKKEYKCKICKKTFHDTITFGKHARMHIEERPFVCSLCDIGFKMKVHLKKHNLYVHSDEYPCACSYCGKRFKDSSAVKLHERIHSNMRPFECDACGKTFKTNENLWGHQHRGKCHAMLAKTGETRGGESNDVTAEASLTGENRSVNAIASSNQVTAQAYIGNSHVTARAVISNNQLTAHASIISHEGTALATACNNNLKAHATLGSEKATAQAYVNEKSKMFRPSIHIEDITSEKSIGVANPIMSMPNDSGIDTNAVQANGLCFKPIVPADAVANLPPIVTTRATTAIRPGDAIGRTCQRLQPMSAAARNNPIIASALSQPLNCPPVEVSQIYFGSNTSPPKARTAKTPPVHGSPSQRLPTLKEFLARGVAGSKSPAWHLGTSSMSQEEGPGIFLTRQANTPNSVGLTPPRKSPAYGGSSPFMGRVSPCSDISPFGPMPPLSGSCLDLGSPLLRNDDPSIPIIYWDDDSDQKNGLGDWSTDTESIFHEISDSVITQL